MDSFILCPACQTKNTVPEDDSTKAAGCSHCHGPLPEETEASAWAVPVSDISFEEKVLHSPLPVLHEFVSSGCTVCRKSKPVVDALAAEWKGRVRVCRTDVVPNSATADRYDILSTPTNLIFSNGALVDRIVGVPTRELLLQKMEPYLG